MLAEGECKVYTPKGNGVACDENQGNRPIGRCLGSRLGEASKVPDVETLPHIPFEAGESRKMPGVRFSKGFP